MPFVLDNSVVCGWLLDSQSNPYTEAVAQLLLHDHAHAPPLLHLEYANVMRTACKRGVMIAQQAQAAIQQLALLPIQTDKVPPQPAQLLALALRYDLSAYDAAYLELALRLQLPIATVDTALADAARAAGVGVVTAEA